MKRFTITLTGLLCCLLTFAQQQFSGKVYDAYTNTPIEGAHIFNQNGKVTTTNKNGEFTLPCQGEVEITISHISYERWKGQVDSCQSNFLVGLIPSVLNLNAVEVNTSPESDSKMIEQPQSMALLSRGDLLQNHGLFLEQTLNLEPGIRMEKRTMSGGQRITIRGYGNGTNFNGTGYKAYINGIPITDASGNTIMDDIDFSTLGKVEVIKGPASSLYGTGIAGVVNMYTLKPTPQETSVSQEVLAGSYGLLRTNTRLESATDKSSILINYGHQNYDSYRVHSASKKDYVSFVGDFRPNEKQLFSSYFSYNNSYEQLAGQVDSAQFVNRENVAEAPYLKNDGHVAIESFRAGVSHRYNFSKKVSNMTSLFTSGVRHNQTYAVGQNDNLSQNFGGRTEFRLSFEGEKVQLKGIVGSEFQKTTGLYKTYSMFGGIVGGLNSDNDIASMQYSVFTQWDLLLPKNYKITLGASSNFIEYDINDMLANSSNPNHLDASGYKTFDPVITPRISLQKLINEKISAYVSVSQGYSPPTTSDVVIPYTGEVNTGLNPETATQYEIGTKGNLLDSKLSYQLAFFRLNVQDKLTSRAVTDNSGSVLYTYTVNSGDQINDGVELSLSYTAIDNKENVISTLRPFVTLTYSDFNYDDFKSDANNNEQTKDYSGNTVIGVPSLLFNAGLNLVSKYGFYFDGSFQYVDDMYITFDNNHEAPAYSLLNAKLGYQKTISKHWNIDLYAGGNNLTNSLYYNMVFINWERGPQPSIYSPGAFDPTFYGGAKLKYTF